VRPPPKLLVILKSTTPEQRYESFSWFVYNLFGATLPIWLGGYILLPIFGKHFSWIEYSKHGELALYSAAFLAPTLRLIGKDVEDSVFVRRQSFLFFGWIFLTAAVALYSGVISAEMPSPDAPNALRVDTCLLFGVSIFLFVFSVLFSSLVRLIDFQRMEPKQFFKIQHASEKRLDEEFDRTTPRIDEPSNQETSERKTQESADAEPQNDLNPNVGSDDGTEN
jgi:hypothetical protein